MVGGASHVLPRRAKPFQESRRDSGSKPKVVPTHRDYFGVTFIKNHQPQRGCGSWLLTAEHVRVTTPLGLFSSSPYRPRVVPMDRDNPGLEDAIPLGLNRTAAQKMRCAGAQDRADSSLERGQPCPRSFLAISCIRPDARETPSSGPIQESVAADVRRLC